MFYRQYFEQHAVVNNVGIDEASKSELEMKLLINRSAWDYFLGGDAYKRQERPPGPGLLA